MVFHFHPRGYTPASHGKPEANLIYMGRDKYENEDLIKYGLPTDVWFHVDDMSSAHVYLRLADGATMDDIPADTLEDCAQLVKQNSIQGCKANNVTIVYTPWANLRKTNGMDVGQVGFHDNKAVRKVKVDKKINDIVNRLDKTRKELSPDFAAEREEYDRSVRAGRRAEAKAAAAEREQQKREHKKQEDLKHYKSLMDEEHMVSNRDIMSKYSSVEEAEDDFM